MNNSTCTYETEKIDCSGNCKVAKDCAGVCGGLSKLDQCGICGGDDSSCQGCMDPAACNYDKHATINKMSTCRFSTENFDCFSICKKRKDCLGRCGGNAKTDSCGICGGNGMSCKIGTVSTKTIVSPGVIIHRLPVSPHPSADNSNTAH